jgi:hypothetical protein
MTAAEPFGDPEADARHCTPLALEAGAPESRTWAVRPEAMGVRQADSHDGSSRHGRDGRRACHDEDPPMP